jgi:hypothetical protein
MFAPHVVDIGQFHRACILRRQLARHSFAPHDAVVSQLDCQAGNLARMLLRRRVRHIQIPKHGALRWDRGGEKKDARDGAEGSTRVVYRPRGRSMRAQRRKPIIAHRNSRMSDDVQAAMCDRD